MNEDREAKLKSRKRFVKTWNNKANGRITTMYAPHSTVSCSKEFLTEVKEIAERDCARIHMHLLETEAELDIIKKRYGMCSINLLNEIDMLGPNVLAAHCIWLSNNDIEIIKNKKVNVVHCPSSNIALGSGTAPVPTMLEKGINVALGTDGPASGGNLDMWNEMRAALMLHKLKDSRAISASIVLEMATINGARALGINAGMIRTGCLADIIIINLMQAKFISSNLISSLVNGASGCDVKTSIVNGKILMDDHRIAGIDEKEIIEKAGRAISRIIE